MTDPTEPHVANLLASTRIQNACEAQWSAHKSDCSAFARAVAASLGVRLTGDADAIASHVATSSDWANLQGGPAAATAASEGYLVLAVLKGAEHAPPKTNGHVAVVVGQPLAHGKYPTAYWGTLGGIGAKQQTLNYAWTKADRDSVTYAKYSVRLHDGEPLLKDGTLVTRYRAHCPAHGWEGMAQSDRGQAALDLAAHKELFPDEGHAGATILVVDISIVIAEQ